MALSIIDNQSVSFRQKHFAAELVTNGSFTLGSSWTFENGSWSIDTVLAKAIHNNSVPGSASAIYQSIGIESNKTYRIRFDVRNVANPVAEQLTVTLGGATVLNVEEDGFYEVYLTLGVITNTQLRFTAGGQFELRLDAVSVQELIHTDDEFNDRSRQCDCLSQQYCQPVQWDDNTAFEVRLTPLSGVSLVYHGNFAFVTFWTFGAGWAHDAVNFEADATASNADLEQAVSIGANRYYKINFTIKNYAAGSVQGKLGGVAFTAALSANGTFEYWVTTGVALSNSLLEFTGTGFTGSIDDVAVVEYSTAGYAVTDEDGNVALTDAPTSSAVYDEDWAMITIDWNQLQAQEVSCFFICVFDLSLGSLSPVESTSLGDDISSGGKWDYIFNGDFENSTFWTVGADWIIAVGAASFSGLGTVADRTLSQGLKNRLLPGVEYTLIFNITAYLAGTLTVSVGGTTVGTYNSAGVKSTNFTLASLAADGTLVAFLGTQLGSFSIDNIAIIARTGAEEEEACSQCYNLRETHPCTLLVQASNDDAAFGLSWSGNLSIFEQSLRLRSKIWKPKYPEEKENFRDSAGNDSTLYFDSKTILTLSVEQVPEYIHRCLRVLLGHDNVTITDGNGVESAYVKEPGDYDPVWRNSSNLAPVEVELTPDDDIARNSNCT